MSGAVLNKQDATEEPVNSRAALEARVAALREQFGEIDEECFPPCISALIAASCGCWIAPTISFTSRNI